MKFAAATTFVIASVLGAVKADNLRGLRKMSMNTPSMYTKKRVFKTPPSLAPKWKYGNYDVKLTPGNEVSPFEGIEFASGSASVTIKHWRACIEANVDGFRPQAAHIHVGAIDENGDVVIDFTPLIMEGESNIKGCVRIDKPLAFEIMERPDLYYVNIHLGSSQPLILQAIRGQLVSGFTTDLEIDQVVAPFNAVDIPKASGTASVQFENAGTVACWDVTINNFDPALGHVHMEAPGKNGGRIFNYSSLKVDDGRFFGCQELGTADDAIEGDVEAVKALLANPTMYYFDYHLSSDDGGKGGAGCTENCFAPLYTSIRGQILADY